MGRASKSNLPRAFDSGGASSPKRSRNRAGLRASATLSAMGVIGGHGQFGDAHGIYNQANRLGLQSSFLLVFSVLAGIQPNSAGTKTGLPVMNVSLRFSWMTRAYRRFRKAVTILKREFGSSFLSRSSGGIMTREALRQECARQAAREPALREAIDAACPHWAKHQRWSRMAYLVASAFLCRRMMPASARNESFTALALGNTFATSASSTTTFVPCA